MRNDSTKIAVAGSIFGGAYAIDKILFLHNLQHFSFSEFGYQGIFLDKTLLTKLDKFRHLLNAPVRVSPVPGSMLRFNPDDAESQHFFLKGRAIDVLIPVNVSLNQAYQIALQCGFNGIGVYPHWKPSHGLHLDVRSLEDSIRSPAQWGGVNLNGKQVYVSLNNALSKDIIT